MPLTLSDDDRQFRKTIKINLGNWDKICDELNMNRLQVAARLRNKRHRKWWLIQKQHLKRDKANARNRKAYRKRKLAAIEPDLQYIIEKSKIP
jgi:hypothetical protein